MDENEDLMAMLDAALASGLNFDGLEGDESLDLSKIDQPEPDGRRTLRELVIFISF